MPDQDGPPAFGTSQTAGIAAMGKMSTLNGLIILSLYLPCFVAIAATTLRIENTTGNIYVEVVMGSTGVTMSASSPNRAIRSGDAEYSNFPERLLLVAHSSETDPVNLKVSVPHTVQLEVVTTSGSITLSGLLPTVNLMTHSGDIKLVAPWRFTRLHLRSEQAPQSVATPKMSGVRFISGKSQKSWLLVNARNDAKFSAGSLDASWYQKWDEMYGDVQIRSTTPGRVELADWELPKDSLVRQPSDAEALLKAALASRRTPKVSSTIAYAKEEKPSGDAMFKASVRLLPLTASVHDPEGHAVSALVPGDFEVVEDGVPQVVSFASSANAPFNLVLLLDLSSSTLNTRALMLIAARRFVEIARTQDRVAVYALAHDMFHVVLPLTSDRKLAGELIDRIPQMDGGTPLYDALALSMLQSDLYLSGERSAVVALTDGMDNDLEGPHRGSKLPFNELREAAAELPVVFYPILLPYDPSSRQPPAEERLRKLAAASGGRLFVADSLERMEPVYEQVAAELRSVYALGYYPRNQEFNGAWRKIQVRLRNHPELKVRTRDGYFAW